jgi:YidC/Oxa1 family membrane protein insertase
MSVLDPITHALAAVLAAAHAGLTELGANPASGTTWLLSIAAIVVVVRLALLPIAAHGVRQARAAARARPQLQKLAEQYKNKKDPDSLRQHMTERRRISAEHGVSPLGCLPLLAQLPIWFALYRLISDSAGGHAVGAMSVALVTSLTGANVLGVRLAERGYLGAGLSHLAVVAGFALTAAALSYLTQKYFVLPNTVTEAMPDAMVQVQHLMPALAALGLVVAAGVAPVGLLAYWVCNSLWTLVQSAVIWRWFPTPGSPASMRARTS